MSAPNREQWLAANIAAWKKAKKQYTAEELETAQTQLSDFYDNNDWDAEPEAFERPPRILSRRALIEGLLQLGIWADIKAMIESVPNGWDLFTCSNDIAEDHPMYLALEPTMREKLTAAGVTDIDAWLDACILERY